MLPAGAVITTATLTILLNQSPTLPTSDFTQQPVQIDGRQVWCTITGGVPGTDYQCRWTITDSLQNNWIRTATLLCAETS